MMYITVEQFLEADEKVKNSIIKWWKNNAEIGDLVEGTNKNKIYCLVNDFDLAEIIYLKEDEVIIPLLTIQQLIGFIKDRTGKAFGMHFGEKWSIHLWFETSYGMEEEMPRWYREEMSFCDEELIQALWKCACEVATDSYYDK